MARVSKDATAPPALCPSPRRLASAARSFIGRFRGGGRGDPPGSPAPQHHRSRTASLLRLLFLPVILLVAAGLLLPALLVILILIFIHLNVVLERLHMSRITEFILTALLFAAVCTGAALDGLDSEKR